MPPLDSATLFEQPGGVWQSHTQGDQEPVPPNFQGWPAFSLKIPPGSHQYFIRVRTDTAYTLPLMLRSPEGLQKNEAQNNLIFGLFVGGAFVLAFYHGFLFATIGRKEYAYFALFLIFMPLYFFAKEGSLVRLLYPGSLFWKANGLAFALAFTGIFFSLFAIKLLELKKVSRGWYGYYNAGILLSLPTFVLGILFEDNSAAKWITWVGLAIVCMSPVASGWVYFKTKNSSAIWLTLAITGFALQALVDGLVVYEVSGVGFSLKYGYTLGLAWIGLTLAVALGLSFRNSQKRQAQMQLEMISLLEDQSHKLKQMVAERTYELQKANEHKDQFLAIIGHDLRGPINNVTWLFNNLDQTQEALDAEMIDEIRSSMNNTQHLLEDLLSWATNQLGNIQYSPEPILIEPWVNEVVSVFAGQAKEKEIEFLVSLEAGAEEVYADKAMVSTVLRNLISNALKYSHPQSSVEITAQSGPKEVRFSVTDTGIGMSLSTQEKLFKIDQKMSSHQGTNGEKGTGMGLIFCSDMVKKNGGMIGVQSQEGAGSTFWFTLPRLDPSATKER
ncbi:MAG: sensor histidine kinase [bacterium]|nr:sensor histidine kinase [bacterium]